MIFIKNKNKHLYNIRDNSDIFNHKVNSDLYNQISTKMDKFASSNI